MSDLITIAGGEDIFSEYAAKQSAKDRIIADPLGIVGRAPQIIIGPWCGKKFRPENVAVRPSWAGVPALTRI